MTISVEGDKLLITGVEVTGSQSAVSGKKAQQIAEYLWPRFGMQSLTEELKPRVEALRVELASNGVTAEMLQSSINYLVTAKDKHARSLQVNIMHISLVVDLLCTTRDQMFPGFSQSS